MMRSLTLLGLGGGLMYFFDPDRGRSRRALARDRYRRGLRQLDEAIDVTVRDLGNRAGGLVAGLRQTFSGDSAADDRVITERVRATMGRYVSHPRALEVSTADGHVTIRGPILTAEVEDLMTALAGVRGVRGIDHQMDVHERPEGVPALQGGRARTGTRSEICQQTWSPTMRLLVGAAAGALAFKAARHRALTQLALGGLGMALAARAAQHLPAAGLWPTDRGWEPATAETMQAEPAFGFEGASRQA